MATNYIYPFAQNATGADILSDANYQSDAQRSIGNQPGIARLELVNKALRSDSVLAAALAQFIADNQTSDVHDSLSLTTLVQMFNTALNSATGLGFTPAHLAGNATQTFDVANATTSSEAVNLGQLNQVKNPAGAVQMFAMSVPPTGWLKSNGAAVSRTTYSALYSAIGTTFGAGDGSTTFNVPDLRGEFARGFDDGRGIDSGRTFGSSQADEFRSHTHTYNAATSGGGATGSGGIIEQSGATTGATGGNETRPRNIALLACIKY